MRREFKDEQTGVEVKKGLKYDCDGHKGKEEL